MNTQNTYTEDAFSWEELSCWSTADLAEYVREYIGIADTDDWSYSDLISAVYQYNHE